MEEEKLKIHIDYLSFTFPLKVNGNQHIVNCFEEYKQILADLFYCDVTAYGEIQEFGQNNYEYTVSLGQNIRIRFGGKSTMMYETVDPDENIKSDEKYESCQVELKGQACREIEFLSGGTVDYVNIIATFLYEFGGKATRIDFAIDDTKGDIITIDEVIKYVKKGWYTSSFRSLPELYTSVAADNDESVGKSLYFGKSRGDHKNELELCIYNKKAERKFNNDTYLGEYWTRYEIRFRGDKADNVAYYMVKTNMQDIPNFACGQLDYILKLRTNKKNGKKTEDNNVRKWDILPEWNEFLDGIKGSSFRLKPEMVQTIDQKVAWRSFTLPRQDILLELADAYNVENDIWIDKSFASVYKKMIDMREWLSNNKLNQADIEMINNYLRSKKKGSVQTLTKADIESYISELDERIEDFRKRYTLPF